MLRPVLHFGKNSLYKTDQIPLQNSCVPEAHLCASGAIVIYPSQRLVNQPLAGTTLTYIIAGVIIYKLRYLNLCQALYCPKKPFLTIVEFYAEMTQRNLDLLSLNFQNQCLLLIT